MANSTLLYVAMTMVALLLVVTLIGVAARRLPSPSLVSLGSLLLGPYLPRLRYGDLAPLPPSTIISHLGDGVLVVDPRGRLIELNTVAAQIFGCSPERALGHPVADLLSAHPTLVEAFRQGATSMGELMIERTPDTIGSYTVQLIPLRGRHGQPLGTLFHLHDITELKVAEEHRHLTALRRHAEQILLQRVARAINANLSLETIFATTVEQIHAAFGYQLVSLYLVEGSRLTLKAQIGHTRIAHQLELSQVFRGPLSHADRPHFIRDLNSLPALALGAPVATAAMLLPLKRGDGPSHTQLLGMLYVASTGDPPLSSDDYALLQVLAEQVSVAVVNARLFSDLRASEAAAAAAARAKSEFLANMSHEIRTPLNAVLGAVSLLLTTGPTPDQRRLLELIRTSGNALLNQLSDILDFALIESGRLPLELVPFDPRRCIEEALDLVRPQALVKQLRLSSSVDAQTPTALVSDPDRLRQILLILLDNAVKFTDSGAIAVTMTTRLQADQRYKLQIAVRDTGPGLSPELAARLFQSFTQGNGQDAHHRGGTGLGLAMARRLSELLDGSIIATSAPGQGATFIITITADRIPSHMSFYMPGIVPRLRGRRVLIIDRSDGSRQALILQLRAWGMRPVAPATYAAAADLLHRHEPFDLALVTFYAHDPQPPQLVQVLRQLRPAEQLPIIAIVAPDATPQRYQLTIGSVQAWLPSPLKAAQLHAILLTLLPAITPALLPSALRVLLVEDDATNQLLIEHLLALLGHQVFSVTSGAAALTVLEQERFDLALLDIQMPAMDGLELARTICRRWPRSDRPYLIALTAHALLGDREQCLAAGMDDYLSKPVSLEAIQQLLARYYPYTASLPPPTGLTPEAFTKIGHTYLEDTTRLLEAMQEALAQSDRHQLAHLAHKLKSSSAIVDALPLSQLCQQLESEAPEAAPEQLKDRVAAIATAYQQVSATLNARLSVQSESPPSG